MALRTLSVLAVMAALACGTAVGANGASAPVRIAVLTGDGDRAVADATLAQLEVALTETKDVALLERAQIRKILAEQKLTASGLTNPAAAVRLGRLLSVDLFLFVERIPKTNPPLNRWRATETESGIALLTTLVEDKPSADAAPDVRSFIDGLLAKSRVPAAQRHYLGILGIRNDSPGRALDPLAEALGMLLANDLDRMPEVVLLEREHLQWLTQEKEIAGAAQQLKLSSLTVEGSLQRAGSKAPVELRFVLRPLAGGEARSLAPLVLLETGLDAARRMAVEAIAREIRARPVESASANPAAEAAVLTRQALRYAAGGYPADFVRAAEAAYALQPCADTRLLAAGASRDRVRAGSDFYALEPDDKRRSLNSELRFVSLLFEQYRRSYPIGDTPLEEWPRGTGRLTPRLESHAGLGILISPEAGDVRDLEQQVADLRRAIYDHLRAWCAADFANRQEQYRSIIGGGANSLKLHSSGYAEAKVRGLRIILDAIQNPPGPWQCDEYWGDFRMSMVIRMGQHMQRCHPGRRDCDQATRAIFLPFYQELLPHPDPIVRLTANSALLWMGENELEAALAIRKIITTEIPAPNHPCRSYGKVQSEKGVAIIGARCIQAVGKAAPADLTAYAESLIGPWLSSDTEAWRLVAWQPVLNDWFGALERGKRFSDVDAVALRALCALDAFRRRQPEWDPSEVGSLVHWLNRRRAAAARNLPNPPVAPAPWPEYATTPLPFTELRGLVTVAGGRLYAASSSSADRPSGERKGVLNVYAFPQGGKPILTAGFSIPAGRDNQPIQSMAVSPKAVYIGLQSGLVEITLAGGRVRVLSEANGLPSDTVGAMAWLDGALYLALGAEDSATASRTPTSRKFAFCRFDPATGESRVLATAATPLGPLGVEVPRGGRFGVNQLIADPKRKCIWIGASNFYGLMRYDPAKNAVERKRSWSYALDQVSENIQLLPDGSEGLLFRFSGPIIVYVDLDTLKQTWLVGDPQRTPPDGSKAPPVLGVPGNEYSWPALYNGLHLFAGNDYPVIYSADHFEALNCGLISSHFVPLTPNRFLIIGGGKAYSVERKTNMPPRPAPATP